MVSSRPTPVMLCLGGGTDSTALIDYYLQEGFNVRGIHFDYGQPSCEGERQAVAAVSRYYNIAVILSDLHPKPMPKPNGEYPCRNALVVLAAALLLGQQGGLVSLGIHSGTDYYDCTSAFANHVQRLLDGYFGGLIVLDTPFIDHTKQDIYAYCRVKEVPVALTYSCERNRKVPCGECLSCRERTSYDIG